MIGPAIAMCCVTLTLLLSAASVEDYHAPIHTERLYKYGVQSELLDLERTTPLGSSQAQAG